MIARTHRFHGYSSLRFVYRHGQTVRDPLLALRYVVNERQKSWRLAVVVSRKVSKSAVVRNRIRRRIYEIVRLSVGDFNEPQDFVVIAFSPQLAELETAKLSATVLDLFKHAGVKVGRLPAETTPDRDIVKTKDD